MYLDVQIYIKSILLSHKEEWNLAICNNMDRYGGIMLREISQLEKDKNTYDFIHSLFKKQNK